MVNLAPNSISRSRADELAAKAGLSPDVATAIYLMTQGRSSYFLACLTQAEAIGLTDPSDVVTELRGGPHLEHLVTTCVANCSKEDLKVVRILAALRCVPRRFLQSISDSHFEDRLSKGGPLLESCPRGVSLTPPLGDFLRPAEPLPRTELETLATQLSESCGLQHAAQVLSEAGYFTPATSVLREVCITDVDEANLVALGSLLTTVLDFEQDDGTLGLLLARVHHNERRLGLQKEALKNASRAARSELRLSLAVEADAELLMVELQTIPPEVARARLSKIEEEAKDHATRHALIRLREIGEALRIHSYGLADIHRSLSRVQAIARQWEAVGEPERASATLRMLVASSVSHLGLFTLGLELLDDARRLVRTSPQGLLRVLSLMARMAALAGELETYEELAAEAEGLHQSVGTTWLAAFKEWSAMVAAGQRQSASQVNTHLTAARNLLEETELLAHPTGVCFLSDAARALTWCNDLTGAQAVLDEMAGRSHEELVEYSLASFMVKCRTDPGRVDQWLHELTRTRELPEPRRWVVDLEALFATTTPTPDQLASIRSAAAQYGLGHLFDSLRRSLEARPNPPQPLVRVLGPFTVEKGDIAVQPGSTRVSEFLALLAVRRGPVHVEVVVDRLWPDVPFEIGATRLRNVVKRARELVGSAGIVRAGATVSLGTLVQVDLHEFDDLLFRFEEDPSLNLEALLGALGLYQGDLLEDFIYVDWTSAIRKEVSDRAVQAVNLAITEGLSNAQMLRDKLASRSTGDSPLHHTLGRGRAEV